MRRIFWNIYAWPVTLLILMAETKLLLNRPYLLDVVDFAFSLPALIALHAHIWDKRLLSARFWKPYAFFYLAWDFLYNLIIEPKNSGEQFNNSSLIVLVMFLPLYISVFRYAFRKLV